VTTNPTGNNRPDRTREMLDTRGAAAHIASSVRHVRRLVAERRIPHYKVGHFVRFDRAEIDRWLDEHRRGPGDAPAA
jgi:excisionase family DNA binding protein